jgi:hypothetical protein
MKYHAIDVLGTAPQPNWCRPVYFRTTISPDEQVVPKERALHQLKALEEAGRMADLLAAVQECEGHASVFFPHCPSDARKEGHVIPVVSFDGFKLRACTEDGRPGKRMFLCFYESCALRSFIP